MEESRASLFRQTIRSQTMPGPSQHVAVSDKKLSPLGYEQITVDSAKGLTVPTGATHALIQAQDQDIRWRDDGTDPTDTVGVVLKAGYDIWYTGDLSAFKAIQTAATGKLNVVYYKPA